MRLSCMLNRYGLAEFVVFLWRTAWFMITVFRCNSCRWLRQSSRLIRSTNGKADPFVFRTLNYRWIGGSSCMFIVNDALDRTLFLCGWYSLIFGRPLVGISARALTAFTEPVPGFPQYLQASVGIVTQLRSRPLSYSSQFVVQ